MTLGLIYYKNVLDLALEKFFDAYGSMFTKQDGKWVLSAMMTKLKLEKTLSELVALELEYVLSKINKPYSKCILIGSCYPKDSLLLDFREGSLVPKWIEETLQSKPALKWVMKENDICIDIDAVNEVAISIFNKMFQKCASKRCSTNNARDGEVIVVSHSHLDCYMMFKVIKWAYGRSNCENVWKGIANDHKEVLVALNDELAKHIVSKGALNKSKKFKTYAKEVRDYLDSKIGISRDVKCQM